MQERVLSSYERAVRDFQRARKSAVLRQALARLRGQPGTLLDYASVQSQIEKSEPPIKHGLQEIELDKIIGSVGRYQDFTRDFLPLQPSDETRWANVKVAMTEMAGIPPIDVYQLGDVYFVLDGNHRVSVARKLGARTISAYVTEIKTRMPFSAQDDPDEVICKARYGTFLERTGIDKQFPEANLQMTFCGQYGVLDDQIELYRQRMEAESPTPISVEEAAGAWYAGSYLPVINVIRLCHSL